MHAADVDSFAAVIAAVKRAEFGAEAAHAALAARESAELAANARGARARLFVAEREARLVGGAGIVPLTAETCELRVVFLLPEARGLGLGRALVERCLEAARELGYERCYLETMRRMAAARSLYLRLGFVDLPRPLRAVPDYVDCWMTRELERFGTS